MADSTAMAGGARVAHLSEGGAPRRGRFDPIAAAAALFFVLTMIPLGLSAFQAGPVQGPWLMLIGGTAGVLLIGVFAFGGERTASAARAQDDVLGALDLPAAVASPEGKVIRANAAWREVVGTSRRLPRSDRSADLFAAFGAARNGGAGRASLSAGGEARDAAITRVSGDRFLIRLEPKATAAEPAALPLTSPPVMSAPVPVIAQLDAFSASAPFGAAALRGSDPFEAVIVECNPALATVTRGRAKPGVPFGSLLDPAGIAEARARLQARRGAPVEVKLAGEGARTAHLYLSGGGGVLLAYLLDVSEQKQLELQLSQSQKMQAIGQLAGGVAHDFNNLLTAIQFRLDELLHRHPLGDPSYEGLNEIRQTVLRSADLVRKLLAFSRKSTLQREVLDLSELISECEVLLRRLLREDVTLVTDHGANLPYVKADKSQLETAVMNLAVNARDAMRPQGGGTVTIRTARLSQGDARALGYVDAPAAECALIEVIDTGPGMSAEVQAKVFEPFFTTKPLGEGTGLGLATVYGIVKQADGWIHVESAAGKGAAFRIFLPVFDAPAGQIAARAAAKAAKAARPAPRDLSGNGRILFVEDESAVRVVAARLLRARGYEVIEAGDGEEGLQAAKSNAGKIDLLISDVIMPAMDGPTMLKKARPYLGSAPVMFMSGYAEAEFSDVLEGEPGVSFLPKPLDIKTLAERVKQQLAA